MKSKFRRGALLIAASVFSLSGGAVRWATWDPLEDPAGLDPLAYRASSSSTFGREKIVRILQDRAQGIPSSQLPSLAAHLMDLCTRYRFDPAFLLAVIQVESGFRANAVSPKGALGLMQLRPQTAISVVEQLQESGLRGHEPFVGAKVEQILLNPFHNLSIAVAYLAYLRNRYAPHSSYAALAAYNVGPTRMDELLSRKTFKPDKTKRYFDAIRREQRCLIHEISDCHV
jgi:soluble lytic murein transglycosylase-like protein